MGIMDLLSSKSAAEERSIFNITKDDQAKSFVSEMANKAVSSQSKDIVYSSLMRHFNDPAIVAGIMGNIDVETGGTFSHTQKENGGSGVGLFQFTYKPMKRAYDKFLIKTKSDDSIESQISFIKSAMDSDKYYELGEGNRNKLRDAIKTKNPSVIATAFSNIVERPEIPHLERRVLSAQKHFEQIRRNK